MTPGLFVFDLTVTLALSSDRVRQAHPPASQARELAPSPVRKPREQGKAGMGAFRYANLKEP